MKMVIAFVVGVIVGSVAALMLSPKSGEELRQELRQEAKAERDRLKSEYTQAVETMQQRLDKVHGDVQEALASVKEKGQTAVATEQPAEAA